MSGQPTDSQAVNGPKFHSEHLLEQGYVLVQLPPAEWLNDRKLFGEYLEAIPEFKELGPTSGELSAGAFGAFPYASSYHNPAAISADETVSRAFRPVLDQVAEALGLQNVELIPDRLCVRTRAQPKESWHTDQTPGGQPEDVFYGGIYNLNQTQTQEFILVPGSHQNCSTGAGQGFTRLQAGDNRFAQRELRVRIPPGHFLAFNENIVHRVAGGTPREPIWRKFVGFRVTNSPEQWCPENRQRAAQQAALVHKGGQLAPMVPRLWLTNCPGKCEAFSARLRPELVTQHTYKSGQRAGQTIRVPKREPPSLTELGCRYPEADPDRFGPKRRRTTTAGTHQEEFSVDTTVKFRARGGTWLSGKVINNNSAKLQVLCTNGVLYRPLRGGCVVID